MNLLKPGFLGGVVLSAALLLASCDETVTPQQQLEIDKEVIRTYAAEKGLSGTFTTSGLYYVIEKEGVGTERPTSTSLVEIIYTGSLLDSAGTVFDSSNGFPYTTNGQLPQLNVFIAGWVEGVQLFKRESKGILLIPSGLAYGTRGSGSIPPNTVLRFDIELIDFE
ncbi:MAG: FKBP-type peptidyl-prolyl cis-trans isomerase [Bacteroidia bacterium]|nr:FKBP-type peptidyl-prolyl cis-trans isomerase [Bacteroidia bacterium]